MNRLQQGITVVISAWQAQDFIEECLDSILLQDWNFKQLEVIVGVDGCHKTMRKIIGIRDKYIKLNLKLYWFPDNKGVYITTNTLITLAKYDNIVTFGADDIMNSKMIYSLMEQDCKYNMIKYNMLNFDCTNRDWDYVYRNAAEGSRFFLKKVFMLVGGYMPWRHTGDSEFISRLRPVMCEYYLKETLFNRRLHPNALTLASQTRIGSDERNFYKQKIYENYNNGVIQIPMVVNNRYKIIQAPRITMTTIKPFIDEYIKEFSIIDYIFYSGNSMTMLGVFFQKHKYVITYSTNEFDHKEIPVINKYYRIMKDLIVFNKHLTLWIRLK